MVGPKQNEMYMQIVETWLQVVPQAIYIFAVDAFFRNSFWHWNVVSFSSLCKDVNYKTQIFLLIIYIQ